MKVSAFDLIKMYNVTTIPIDPVYIANQAGLKVYEQDLGDKSGLIKKDDKDGIIIIVNSKHSHTRKRFTVAHELGHYFNGDFDGEVYMDDTIKPDNLYFRDDTKNQTETAANHFAAQLLMPLNAIKNLIVQKKVFDVGTMADCFEVSHEAMYYRLKRVNLI